LKCRWPSPFGTVIQGAAKSSMMRTISGGYDGLFNKEDITDAVKAHWSVVPKNVEAFKDIVNGPEPKRHITGHCKKPYLCEFRKYCESQETEYPVGLLPCGQNGLYVAIAYMS